MINYGFSKSVNKTFEDLLSLVIAGLKKEGFGILTEINVKDKFKEKLGVDFKKYVILGACNPSFAYKAIQAEENIGLLLPCNVIVYETEEGTTVSIIKPTLAMEMVDNDQLKEIANKVEEKLKSVFESI